MAGRFVRALRRVEPPPRAVDWSILVLVLFEALSGVLSLGAGHPANGALFLFHGIAGLTLVALVGFKLYRVRHRVVDSRLHDGNTAASVLLAVVALAALGTGIAWVSGVEVRLGFWTLLNVHIGFGLLVVPILLVHLRSRFHTPRRADFEGRRRALQYGALLVFGAVASRATETVGALQGTTRRFTGSRPLPPGEGNSAFPVTSWVADDPDPIDTATWSLSVSGLVDRPRTLGVSALDPDEAQSVPRETQSVLLDCTSGWYTEQDWTGVRLGDVLDSADVHSSARWVTVRSVTGFRWSFPIEEAREMLLATHVGGEPLSHGHGAPLRLVAPNRRGFQWVKWIDSVEVRRRRDPAQWLAVLVSGFG
ncbi:molybdopterin-dependent oxidoreductase [Haloferax sp. MBLA0076]|uniref:Molybdopterin-dependent oxidoreductase n=1 Tax=Haloferax litoreum TaxID=2666140 RepID=A0A6A8GE24_9EURY|nr:MULTISPECIES: molybdopterin-dependent oxidoreductase [Haloferax]KAB1192274.1 molybdopterin-dependent oxidoreductase [Haloferax sp. CBA1148]MRX20732.1 molybdopterin-dependent oxidoreductase [Haloferax litoreum]